MEKKIRALRYPADRPLRVLQVSKWYPPEVGGIETVVKNISQGLTGRAAVRALVCSHSVKTSTETLDGVEVVRAGILGVRCSTPLSFSFIGRYLRMARKADIIQLHAPFPLADVAMLLSRSPAKKIVWWHSDVVRQKKLMFLYRPIMTRMLRRADAIFVSSREIAENSPWLQEHLHKVRVIPFGLDAGEFERSDRFPALTGRLTRPGSRKILFVGRLVYYKGLEVLIRAFAPLSDAELFIVGEGPLRDHLAEEAQRSGAGARIHFLGGVDERTLRAAYADCDMLVLPSDCKSECFGLVQLEAMAYGKPVINTDLPTGVPRVSVDGVSGLTVPPGDTDALRQAMSRLIGDDVLREKLGRGAYERFRECFASDVMADHIYTEYRQILDAPPETVRDSAKPAPRPPRPKGEPSALRELLSYRQMIASFVRRDLRGRYKGSFLGFLWTFINPLMQLVVYTIVFSTLLQSNIEKYYLFLFVALIPWIFFASSVTGGSGSILSQKDMVKKIYFPREVLPVSQVTAAFINMLLCFLVVLAVVVISGVHLNPLALACLAPVMAIEYVLALGMALLASAVTVYFRDMEHILGIVMMAWQYLTPVMYSEDIIPDEYMIFFSLNPMTSVIAAYRDILYYSRVPDMSTLLLALGMGVFFLVVGWTVFERLKRRFVEEL